MTEPDDYVAWVRYTEQSIVTCDSDAPKAFKVYKYRSKDILRLEAQLSEARQQAQALEALVEKLREALIAIQKCAEPCGVDYGHGDINRMAKAALALPVPPTGKHPDTVRLLPGPRERCGGPTDHDGECPKCRDFGGTDKLTSRATEGK
jgi:hypothetical protein